MHWENAILLFQRLCIGITVLIHYLFLVTFFSMLGIGVYYFMSITVTYYAMYVANNFNCESRLRWFLLGVWGRNMKMFYKNVSYCKTDVCHFWLQVSVFFVWSLLESNFSFKVGKKNSPRICLFFYSFFFILCYSLVFNDLN